MPDWDEFDRHCAEIHGEVRVWRDLACVLTMMGVLAFAVWLFLIGMHDAVGWPW